MDKVRCPKEQLKTLVLDINTQLFENIDAKKANLFGPALAYTHRGAPPVLTLDLTRGFSLLRQSHDQLKTEFKDSSYKCLV